MVTKLPTTARVVPMPTPLAPPEALKPCAQLMRVSGAAEHRGLHEALHEVLGLDDPARVLDEDAGVDVLEPDGDAVAAAHRHRHEQQRQQRHHDASRRSRAA